MALCANIVSLPKELQAQLADAGRHGAGHPAKRTAAEVSAGIVELGVIEQVEELRAELHRHALAQGCDLLEAEVPVVESWPVEEARVRVAVGPQRFRGECAGVERLMRVGRSRIRDDETSNEIRGIDLIRQESSPKKYPLVVPGCDTGLPRRLRRAG